VSDEQQGASSPIRRELRRLFPAVTDNEQAPECARAITGW